MIELKNITKTFTRKDVSVHALNNINLRVKEGSIFGVIGYSGAGKSTLVRLVNYLERPTEGQVLINGVDLASLTVKELRNKKKRIGMIFQHFNLLESKTVYDNVALPLVLIKKDKQEISKRVHELLEFVGLGDKESNYPNELSGGQKQRVGIARALASNPSILLCDEATSALDPQTTDSILNLLKRINEEYKITIMMITHEMGVVQKICHEVAVMEKGEIIEQGSVIDIFGRPQHKTTQNFVRTVIQNEVPSSLVKVIQTDENHRLLRLDFLKNSSSNPLINEMIEMYGIKINILFANSTEIQGTLIVTMIVQIEANQKQTEQVITFLNKHDVDVKEIQPQ